ncbi:ABC-2 type transport system ATP-binding protein [Breznakia sp. PH1-1]|nr:ABC-2 type transport system ATP-binding protein [Breznakia sp. PH1-1]MDH6405290.1 ABC-2 type transport system ATP-binding protein [Breznakia sp. PF1-11]MDH6413002.1 ABC-2 type transport system ATP-binding protein [Breznakia sp. PFB1-11]MDH6415364.1 ABC-2 type transport system ATP-binding protein [Breznakia sp. PFB1-14]MDH6417669.1 ABC-2 type transport system ATP-binding protein [Breznakia sp. PFB1-4]MDH6420036.1 ABC-2 type transport system ATP-binding protein [Breznakia sp. PFB1-12]MDH6475
MTTDSDEISGFSMFFKKAIDIKLRELYYCISNLIQLGEFMSDYIVRTKSLTKTYGRRNVVDHINMHVKRGEIYGFIGRNGAGKTTTLKMIANLVSPTSGEMELFGSTDLKQARKKIGVLIENPGLYPAMNAYDNIKMKCLMLGIENSDKKIKELLELVGLQNAANKKAKNFSLGMKQRLGVAMTLVNDPELILLDEPINGLDPQGIVELRDLFLKLQQRGITIIVSSHILEELSKIANRFGVIASGKLIREVTTEELHTLSHTAIVIEVDKEVEAKKVLMDFGIEDFRQDKQTFFVFDKDANPGKINTALVQAGIEVSSIRTQDEDVETMFINMMGGANYV